MGSLHFNHLLWSRPNVYPVTVEQLALWGLRHYTLMDAGMHSCLRKLRHKPGLHLYAAPVGL